MKRIAPTALNGLSTITPGTVTVTPKPGFPGQFLISLALGGSNPAPVIAATNITTPATVNATITTPGGPPLANSAIAQLLQSDQILPGKTVTVKTDGKFDLNNQSQTGATALGAFSITGGTATTGPGPGGTMTVSSMTLSSNALLTTPGTGAVVNVTGAMNVTNSSVTTPGTNSQVNVTGLVTSTDSSWTTSGPGSQVAANSGLNTTGDTWTLSGSGSQLILGGNVTAASDALGPVTISGQGTVAEGSSTRTFTVTHGVSNATSDMIVNSVITGGAGVGLTKAGFGRLELNAASTYPGTTQINTGYVQVDNLAKQTINLNLLLVGGTYTLAYRSGVINSGPSSAITYNGTAGSDTTPGSDAKAIKDALNTLLGTIGVSGSVSVTPVSATVFTVAFSGAAATNLLPMTPVTLSGGAAGTVTVITSTTSPTSFSTARAIS